MIKDRYTPSKKIMQKLSQTLGLEDPKIEEMQNELSKVLYGAVMAVCYRNLAFEHGRPEELQEIVQIKENPKLSIISDSRERFNSDISKIIHGCIEIPEDILSEVNQEFFDYVSNNRGNMKLGDFYLDSGKVYFKTEKSLPKEKPQSGSSIVVGGIDIE